MKEPLRLFFDENIGVKILEAMKGLLKYYENKHEHEIIIKHISETGGMGATDDIWVPKLKNQGWIVFTADRGRNGRVRLPSICIQNGITHVLFSSSIHGAPQFEKARAILTVWSEILDINPLGGRYSLQYASTKKTAVLKKKTP